MHSPLNLVPENGKASLGIPILGLLLYKTRYGSIHKGSETLSLYSILYGENGLNQIWALARLEFMQYFTHTSVQTYDLNPKKEAKAIRIERKTCFIHTTNGPRLKYPVWLNAFELVPSHFPRLSLISSIGIR